MIRSCPQVRKVATQFFICYLKGKLLDEICNKYTIRNTKTVIVSKTRQTVFKTPQRSTLTCVCESVRVFVWLMPVDLHTASCTNHLT